MTIHELYEAVKAQNPRSAWRKGVRCYALELIYRLERDAENDYFDEADLHSPKILHRALLDGARDWNEYSWGGCAFIYDGDIARELCTPSELKKTHNGMRRPNASEEWLDVQARALYQAERLILDCIR